MYLLIVSNNSIKSIIDRLTIKETTKEVLEAIILHYDYSYVNFIYTLFSVYLRAYVRLVDNIEDMSYSEIREIIDKFNAELPRVNPDNILLVDRYDILFTLSPMLFLESDKFTSFIYEYIYNRIEHLIDVNYFKEDMSEEAIDYMEDILEAIEEIMASIEHTIIRHVNKDDEESTYGTFKLHLEIVDDSLYIAFF